MVLLIFVIFGNLKSDNILVNQKRYLTTLEVERYFGLIHDYRLSVYSFSLLWAMYYCALEKSSLSLLLLFLI